MTKAKANIKETIEKKVQLENKKGTGQSTLKLIDAAVDIKMNRPTADDIAYQHTVLCQTILPLSSTKAEYWKRKQGKTSLVIQTELIENPTTGEMERIGLPYGTPARLILAYLNTEAKRTKSPVINVEDSMTAFIRQLGFSTDGRSINRFKEQLRRLAASNISLSLNDENGMRRRKRSIIDDIDLWFPKDVNQRVLWNSEIVLNDKYFSSLVNHAVPIDNRALKSLARSPMAIDIYSWLAQRLYRVDKPMFLTWQHMKEQFGNPTGSMDNFKRAFRNALKNVMLVYPKAKIVEEYNKGFIIEGSPPPISPNTRFISKK